MTTNTWQRRALFLQSKAAGAVERKIMDCRDKGYYLLHAYTVMPDHLHLILTPTGSTTLERALQLIKGGSSHEIRSRFPVWQPGFTEHLVKSGQDYRQHVEYIHQNPVEARLVSGAAEYEFSSARAKCRLDPWPVSSGAEAPIIEMKRVAGLKPRPSGTVGESRRNAVHNEGN